MKKFNIELSTNEIIKLIAVCNSAIVSEEETLRNLQHYTSSRIIENTKNSIEKIWEIKSKLKKTINVEYGNHIKEEI